MIPFVSNTIKYIGTDDRDLDLFESQYRTPEGMCYNSYVILDEKVCIMDTVDARCAEEWKVNLQVALEGRTPDYLVVQHVEPDHAGAIAETMNKYPNLKVVACAKALTFIAQFNEGLDMTDRTITVTDGSTLDLGGRNLHFITAPMAHWPEVIMTYDDGDKAFFSADAFGKFGTYDAHPNDWAQEARRYYFNICGKYGMQVSKVLEKAAQFDIEVICSLHGTLLRNGEMAEALRLYGLWSKYEPENPEGIVIAYASIHGGTKVAARRLAEVFREKGASEVVLHDLCRGSIDHALADAFRLGKLVLAASSYDSEVFPPMHHFTHKLRLKGFTKRRVAIMENTTWAPTAAKTIKAELANFKNLEVLEDVVSIKSALKQADIPALEALADAVMA